MGSPYAEVLIELLPSDKGGRRIPLELCNDRPGLYRPHLRVLRGSGEMLGVAFVDGPDAPVEPGHSTFATVRFLYEPEVSYSELVEGAEFEILEGLHVVGFGRVTKR